MRDLKTFGVVGLIHSGIRVMLEILGQYLDPHGGNGSNLELLSSLMGRKEM